MGKSNSIIKDTFLVSVIVTTKNEEKNIGNCLESIVSQTYRNIEIIVVDNNSTDKTKKIARKFTNFVYNFGPERSSQRNYGAIKAKGEYLLFIDADMALTKDVLDDCVCRMVRNSKIGSIIIPEKSYGVSFWARCKALERSYYEGIDWIEASRFFRKTLFEKIGGFDEDMISGEDWDIFERSKRQAPFIRINQYILHDEGNLSLLETVKTKYYYAKNISKYRLISNPISYKKQSGVINRYRLFLSKPSKLLSQPLIGLGMLFMKSCEFSGGFIGILASKSTSLEHIF